MKPEVLLATLRAQANPCHKEALSNHGLTSPARWLRSLALLQTPTMIIDPMINSASFWRSKNSAEAMVLLMWYFLKVVFWNINSSIKVNVSEVEESAWILLPHLDIPSQASDTVKLQCYLCYNIPKSHSLPSTSCPLDVSPVSVLPVSAYLCMPAIQHGSYDMTAIEGFCELISKDH